MGEVSGETEPGEAYYSEFGWSGWSAWDRLPPASKDGWAHAERLAAGVRIRMAQAWDEGVCHGETCRGGLSCDPRTANPYRVTPPAQTGADQ